MFLYLLSLNKFVGLLVNILRKPKEKAANFGKISFALFPKINAIDVYYNNH